MLNDFPYIGSGRITVTKSTSVQRRPQETGVSCSQLKPVNQHLGAFASTDTTQPKPLKRSRCQDEIDGEEEEHTQRKKRRLRLDLVTSRLSRPYATPATHIIGTRAWRVGAWARQRFVGGKLLRKAAILNWVSMERKGGPPDTMKTSNAPNALDSPRINSNHTTSQTSHQFSAYPAPFQLPSDYEAFDYEEDDAEEESDEDEEEDVDESGCDEDDQAIHSDFRLLEPSDTDPDFFDTSWSFANIDTSNAEITSSGKEIKLVMENERQDEVSFAPMRPEVSSLLYTRNPVMGM